ncbi:hypothetical protein AX769_18070 [Frondihabitans sp. PAMC 28766]|uniref:glycosyltransferase family 39 protein n=1 Tax=Frondihabitans sp. PAMC 28766 TaxID=1795630 RepID=UPI00078E49F2|nr:glycosyltransferase family 39 protein [Frondihabitans sp. PAMC 28766]AMM21706.1 hypothetical protein AX769_18070 [Frondihabitans sp. PAMC 28766]
MSVPPIARRDGIAIGAATAAFLVVLVLWSMLTPVFGAPDELAHFDSVLRFALGYGWAAPGHAPYLNAVLAARSELLTTGPSARPTLEALLAAHPGTSPSTIDQMSQHPPTYYAVAAGLMHAVGFLHLRWDVDLAILRLFDSCLIAPLPLLAWATVRRLAHSNRAGLVGAMSIVLVPQVALVGSAVTNDAPLMLFGGLTIWLGALVLTGDVRWRTTVALALASAAAVATKATGYPSLFFVILVLLVLFTGRLRSARSVAQFVVAGVIVAALGGAWWLRNIVVYHQLQPAGLVRAVLPWPPGHGPNVGGFFVTEWNHVTSSFWGDFGLVPTPTAITISGTLTGVLTVGSIAVIVLFAFRRRSGLRAPIALGALVVTTIVLQLGNNWQSYAATHLVSGDQGRYYFPSIIALVALVALGLSNAVRSEVTRLMVGRALVTLAVLVALYGLVVAFLGFYQGGSELPTPAGFQALRGATTLGSISLLAVIVLTVVFGGVTVVLVWRGLAAPPRETGPHERGMLRRGAHAGTSS